MKYFVANWKLNGSEAMVGSLAAKVPESLACEHLVICPPFPYLTKVQQAFPSAKLGAQDCSAHTSGAYTGEVSAEMAKELGCAYVILGHSERRQHHGETNALVKAKAEQAIAAGLTPIICIGESLKQREAGETLAVLEAQYKESLPDAENAIVAYEPIWAIGTGKVATVEQVAEVHSALKQLNDTMPLLYGGSVKAANIDEICAVQGVDGVLVGSASIDPQQFAEMISAK